MSSYYNDPHQNPYWQNLNGGTSQKQQEGQGSFEQDPNWHPQPEYGRQLGRTAALLGVFSIGSTVFLPIFLPIIFGSIAVVLAILSKGKQKAFPQGGRQALILGTIGLVINFLLLAACIVTFYLILHDPSVRAQANALMQQLYGYSFDDLWGQFDTTFSTGGVL